MKTLDEIREEIHTINPEFSNELLDLLYEYIMTKHVTDFEAKVDTCDFRNVLNYLTNPFSYKDNE